MALTKSERVQACLTGDPALDRPPVALWRHFPVDDQQPETLAAATLKFQETFDFDIVKVTPASSFCLRDWGAEDTWEGHTEGTRTYKKRVIQKPQDWEKLTLLTPASLHLSAQLTCLRLLRKSLDGNTPMLQTVFSPLSQARNLAGGETLLAHLRQTPDAVMKGLEIISESTRRFIAACVDEGVDGIFYAIQHAQAQLLSADEFIRFTRAHDNLLLQSAVDLPFNMLHIHGENIHFEAVARYPVEILNWHDRETDWSLSKARTYYSKLGTGSFSPAFCGGISTHTLVYENSAKVRTEARDALDHSGGKRLILGTGCVAPIIAPYGNILAARQAAGK